MLRPPPPYLSADMEEVEGVEMITIIIIMGPIPTRGGKGD